MPLKRSIAALAVAFGVAGCGATVQTQAQFPTRPILQTGDAATPEAGATKAHGKKRHGRKLSRFFDALAAKDPSVKADLDQLKTRLAGLSKEQKRALHAMWWEANKNNTLDQMRLKLQGFMDTPSTFVTHLKTNLDKLQAMSAAEVTAMADKFPPSTIKQLRQMMRDAKKAQADKAGDKTGDKTKDAGALADDDDMDDDDAADISAKKPADTGKAADTPQTDTTKTDSTKTDSTKTGAQPTTGMTTAGLWGGTTPNPYQSPYSWW